MSKMLNERKNDFFAQINIFILVLKLDILSKENEIRQEFRKKLNSYKIIGKNDIRPNFLKKRNWKNSSNTNNLK